MWLKKIFVGLLIEAGRSFNRQLSIIIEIYYVWIEIGNLR